MDVETVEPVGERERGASCANHSAAKYLFAPPESKLEQLFRKCAICLEKEAKLFA